MAFWSKSDDPWDRKPEKGETRWREQDVPAPQEAEQQEPTAEQQRIRRIIEGPAPAPESAENCPWCGGQMKQVSIYTDKDFLRWRFGEPGGLFDSDYEVLEEARSGVQEAGENEEAARRRRRRGGKGRSGKAKAAAPAAQPEAPAKQPEAKPQPEEKAQKPKAAHRRYHRRRKGGGQKPEA